MDLMTSSHAVNRERISDTKTLRLACVLQLKNAPAFFTIKKRLLLILLLWSIDRRARSTKDE